MVKKKRWGKKYADKRNWKDYNKELVKRGEFYINPVFLETWKEEVKDMNHGKVGQPYFYPDSLIEFSAVLHAKSFDYRAIEGIISALSKKTVNFPVISFSQIRRRIGKVDPEFAAKGSKLVVGTDGSGIKVSNRGEWIRHKWKVQRGWIKVVIMGDDKGNIVDIIVGNENMNENSAAREMIRKKHSNISKFIGDGLYYTADNFKFLDPLDIEPVIKIREDASTQARGCMARKRAVLEYKELGYKKWAKEKGYGKRWVATEGIFSAVKRMFGETVRSCKTKNMYHEAKLKFWAYQQVRDNSCI